MKIKALKILFITVILLTFLLISESSISYADDNPVKNFEGELIAGNESGVTEIRTLLGGILSIIRIAGVGIAIVILTALGAKYMLASAGEKAEIKKHAMVYVIGALVLFGASGILGIIQNFVDSSTGKQSPGGEGSTSIIINV